MSYHLSKKITVIRAVFTLTTLLVSMNILAVPAGADQDSPFTPEFKLETSSTQAGSSTDLTFKIEKTINECKQFAIRWNGPGKHENVCAEEYVEQNLKKTAIKFPNALLADVNAAPYCNPRQVEGNDFESAPLVWECANEDARIGTAEAYVQSCDPLWMNNLNFTYCLEVGDLFGEPPPKILQIWPGAIYNERPHEGEQGRLVILMPRWEIPEEYREENPELPPVMRGYVRADVSVKVRDASRGYSASDIGIDAVADDIPDTAVLGSNPDHSPAFVPGQLQKIKLTIDGDTGSDRGHPLLDNPRICDQQDLKTDVQGYAFNSDFEIETRQEGMYFLTTPGHGDGKSESFSAPYQSTGCEKLPYVPNFDISASSYKAGTSPAITTTVSQSSDQATNKKIEVDIPAGINITSTTVPCPADQLASGNCPAESVLGTATAYSRFIPENEGGNLTGNLYLSEIEGSNFKLALQLRGFVDLDISGTAGIVDDKLRVTFDDLPPVPMDRLDLNLKEGNQSLLALPNRCGTHDVVANFTSHTGKTHTATSPLDVTGCGEPDFDVELSEPGKGKRTGLDLEVSSNGKAIKEVKFGIDRNMKLSTRGLGKKRKFGEVSATSAAGTEEAALKRPIGASQKKKKAFSLKTSALKGLGVNIYYKRFTRKGVKSFKSKRNKKNKTLKKRTVPKLRLSVNQLPSDDLTKVAVSLNPDETKLLRNLSGKKTCHARFLALVKTEDGTKYSLKKKLRLRGKGCGKRKKRKGSSKKH